MGTLIADSAKHGGLYFGRILAAVLGNFIGFFTFGYALRKKFSWARFVMVANLTRVIPNVIVAFLYVFVFKLFYTQTIAFTQMTSNALIVLSVGVTLFWFVTMLPFVLLITPPLIVAIASAFPSMLSEDLRLNAVKQPPKRFLALSMLMLGIIMMIVGLTTTYTSFGKYLSTEFATNYFPTPIMVVPQLLFYVSGTILSIIGLAVLLRSKEH